MLGELVATFCERNPDGAPRAIELWLFPDTTLNLIVASDEKGFEQEACFPCAVHQLQGVIEGRPLTLSCEKGHVLLERIEHEVCASYSGFGCQWRQCVEVDMLQEALDRLLISGVGNLR